MNEHQLTIIDEEGNETLCQILFTFVSEVNNRNIVVFYPVESAEDDEDGIELSAAYFTEDDENGSLDEITEDEVWEEIEDAIHQFEEEYDGCDCEECEHDHCDHEHCECEK